jgi:ribonuclease HI
MSEFIAFFDGCCEPINPGGTMGFGAIVTVNGNIIWQARGVSQPDDEHGQTSNNLAEYAGLLALLDYFIEAGLADTEIEVRSDSKLVIEQMAGRWNIGNGIYVQAAHKARELAARFTSLHFQWIPRAENNLADELSKSELIKRGVEINLHRRRA